MKIPVFQAVQPAKKTISNVVGHRCLIANIFIRKGGTPTWVWFVLG
jgi:hypothetical protein